MKSAFNIFRGTGARAGMAYAIAFAATWAVLEGFAARLHGHYDVIQIESWRFGVQTLLILAVWAVRRGAAPWRTQRPISQAARAVLMLMVPLGFELAVSQGATATIALDGLWLAPVIALGVAHVWLRDRAPLGVWIAAFVGLAATVLLLQPGWPKSILSATVPVLMGLSFALYLAVSRSVRFEAAPTSLFYVGFGGLLLMSPLLPQVWVMPDLRDAILMTAIGVFGWFALWLLDQSLRRWTLSQVAPALNAHVACLVILYCAAHGELPSLRALLGFTAVAGVLVYLARRAQAQDPAATKSVPALFAEAEKGSP